jgi:hypothetical protein
MTVKKINKAALPTSQEMVAKMFTGITAERSIFLLLAITD